MFLLEHKNLFQRTKLNSLLLINQLNPKQRDPSFLLLFSKKSNLSLAIKVGKTLILELKKLNLKQHIQVIKNKRSSSLKYRLNYPKKYRIRTFNPSLAMKTLRNNSLQSIRETQSVIALRQKKTKKLSIAKNKYLYMLIVQNR